MTPPPPPDGPGSGSKGDVLAPDEVHKAKLDDTELASGSPRALQKVELDLDDAPFLEEEEVAPPPPPGEDIPAAPAPQELEEPVKLPPWKNKKVLMIAGAVLLALIGLAVWWFFLRAKPAPPPPPEPLPEQPPVALPEPTAPPPPQEAFWSMDPFLVEKTDDKGVTRLLSLKIKLVYKDTPQLTQELAKRTFSLRDGLYYNLKNKSFAGLTDKNGVDQLREELRGVVNNYLNTGQVDGVLFEELLVK